MDTNETEGFFPEREVLRARRLNATAAKTVDSSAARSRRAEKRALWFVIFSTMFVNAIIFGWNGHLTPRALDVLMYALSAVLMGCGAAVAIGIWKNLGRANRSS